ncbi:MAG: type II secretion system minor pseudopilin GspI [Steroidobacteraceae bacterium]
MRLRGFTLVEVLVALVIVAIGMAAVLASLTSAADTTAYLRERSFAEWVAMNRIAELRLQRQRPADGKSSGDAEFAGRRWRWEQEILELEIPGTRRIDVRVRPADATGGRDTGWVATVSGIIGDAVAPPDGRVLAWPGSGTGTGRDGERSPQGQRPGTTSLPEPGVEPGPPEPETR